MPPDLCPWLGNKTDRETRRATPATEHRCYAQRPAAEIAPGKQNLFCLEAVHRACVYYREPANSTQALPPEASEEPGEEAVRTHAPVPRWMAVFLWVAAILVAAAVITSFALVFWDRTAPSEAAAQVSPTPTPTSSPTPTQSPLPTEPGPSPTLGLQGSTASPTPYPGGTIYSLSPGAGAVGWVSSDESRGNHLGDSFLYAGVFGDVIFHGMLQFDLSSVPRGATIYGAVLEISGLDARRLGGSGVWEMRVLEREIDDGWSRHTYQDIHNADVQWTLPPALGVEDLAAGQTNAFELSREQLQDLEQRLLDEHYGLSFRIDGPLAGQNSVFAWDSGYGPATQERRPRLLLNVGPSPETPIPTGSPPPTNTPTPTHTPTPTNTPEWVVITSTPTPENVVTAAAIALRETAWATTTGTATATPEFVATPTPSYFVVTNTPTPMNRATAIHQQAVATAHIILTGTPTPPRQPLITVTSTPRPTATPAVVWFDLTTVTPVPTTTPQPTVPPLPQILAGKILFLSDRSGEPGVYVLDPGTGRLGWVTSQWPHDLAKRSEILSPDEQSFAYVQNDERRVPQIYIYSREYSDSRQVTFNTGMSYDPAWSPLGDRLAFVSTEAGNDDIYVVGTDGQGMVQLTVNEWEWDKHPSWSPDGRQIVFWSNRGSGRKQLWIMNADGSGQRLLLESDYNDWDPVWVK